MSNFKFQISNLIPKKEVSVTASGEPVLQPIGSKKKKILKISLLAPAVILLLAVLTAVPLWLTAQKGREVVSEAQAISTAFQNQNLDEASVKIASSREKLQAAQKQFSWLKWSRFIPFFGGYYRDGEHLFQAGLAGFDAGDVLIEAIKPYADVMGFEGGSGMEGQTAEERVVFIVQTLEKISPQLDNISQHLNLVKDEVLAINPRRYPQKIRHQEIRQQIVTLQETVVNLSDSLTQLKPALAILPQLLGEPDEKHYLLLFQNDAELRPTGGFLTAYAILKVHRGKFTPLSSEDIYSLDSRFNKRIEAPAAIKEYLPLVYYWNLRDMNLSPDFKVSMDQFGENYLKTSGAVRVDGIIAIDTSLPVELLKVLGPVGVADWGSFSAEEDPRCNCPQVIYALEELADKPVGEVRTGRKAVLGPLMHSILLNIMGSPRKLWPKFFNVGVEAIREKHMMLYFFGEKEQQAAEAFKAAGRIVDYDADYLHINDCNFAGAKSNMFIKENVTQEIETAGDGAITKTLTIDYKNPEPASNCNLEKGELCLNGPYRNWFRIYVPQGSKLLQATGSEVEMKTSEELGKTVFEGFFGDQHPLRPEGSAKVVVKYQLPFQADKGQDYKLLIQKQPGTDGYEYQILVNGEERESFALETDREIKLSL